MGSWQRLGTAVVASDEHPDVRMGWKKTDLGWRPRLHGVGGDKRLFAESVFSSLQRSSMDVFRIEKAMPFKAEKFAEDLKKFQARASWPKRRDVDLLAGMGTEIYPDQTTEVFHDTEFRMIRSGDSKGNGLPSYAIANREAVSKDRVWRTLFEQWDYQDTQFSLRWDPIEDQRYALRWSAPNDPNQYEGKGTMIAANDLAIEALRLLPTLPLAGRFRTTGFQTLGRHRCLVWPIWTPVVGVDTLRALLASQALKLPISHANLSMMGIEEVYCSRRVRQNQYYQNFLPAHPI